MFMFSFPQLWGQIVKGIDDLPSEKTIYHYTSPDGYEGILYNHAGPTFWFSRSDCLNDISEGNEVLDLFQKTINELVKDSEDKEYLSFLDQMKDVKPSEKEFFIADLDEEIKKKTCVQSIVEKTDTETYLCSFSKSHDSLAMWNYYVKGNKYEGFNIGVDTQILFQQLAPLSTKEGFKFRLFNVLYDYDDKVKLIKKAIREIYGALCIANQQPQEGMEEAKECMAAFLNTFRFYFKSDFFQHEEEIRAVITLPKHQIEDADSPFNPEIKYRRVGAYTIPYFELQFDDINLIKSITVGPLDLSESTKIRQCKLIKEQASARYPDVEVYFSKAPVRY